MPNARRTRSRRETEEDLDELLNHCVACGDYHVGPTGPDCPIYKAKQAEKVKKKSPPKKANEDDDSGVGSTEVVSLLETIALGMDQLLKQTPLFRP